MEKKLTKKDRYGRIYAIIEASNDPDKLDLLGFIDHEIELLDKKATKTTLTIKQRANLEILNTIREVMRGMEKAVTISDLIKTEPLKVFTTQKISALMKKLVDSGEVEKTQLKKVSYFTLKA